VFSFPLNSLYSGAFGTHPKTAEPIEMSFGTMTRLSRRYNVLDGGPDPLREMGNFGGERRITITSLPRSLQMGSFSRQ